MSDTSGGESSAAGVGFGAGINVNLPGLNSATTQINSLNSSLQGLNNSLSALSQKSSSLSSSMTTMLSSIQQAATQATAALSNMTSTLGSGGASGAQPAFGNTAGYLPSSSGRSAGMNFSTALGTDGTLLNTLAMFPLRFMQDRVNTNREFALSTATALGGQGFATGMNTRDYLKNLAGMPGNIMGSGADVLSMMQAGQRYGGMLNFSNGAVDMTRSGPRAAGLFAGVQQAQTMNPGAYVSDIASTIGGFASNTGAQQQAQMMTGGAFGMIKPGGGQKSLQEWAESVLRWLEGLRGGSDRGKPFDYGNLMAQYFPGSNIDAWFNANGVPQGMKDYWWEYVLGKTKSTGSTTQGQFTITPQADNLAQQRLQSQTALTTSEFKLGGTLAGTYSNREQSNKWFNELMGSMMQQLLPQQLSSGAMQFAQYLPDTVEDMLMSLLNKTGPVGAIIGGGIGYGPGLVGQFKDVFGAGDVGDVGDVAAWGPNGGTTTAGLNPSMKKRVSAMMRANPNLSITSGLRDMDTQQKLKRKGGNRVSGKASAHTRGMAADLGPSSQYGWIVNNAHKFGLTSGITHGEPWHVGMPGDVGDTASDINAVLSGNGILGSAAGGGFMDFLGPIISLMTGSGTQDQMINLMGAGIPTLFSKLLGFFGTGTGTPSALDFDPTIYQRLVDSSTGALDKTTYGGIAAGPGAGPGPLGPTLGKLGGTLDPSSAIAGFVGPLGNLARAKAAAQVAFNAGFRGHDLWEIVSIGGRESGGWNPGAINPSTSDRGLFQINMAANMDTLKKAGIAYSEADLLDPSKNAMAAHYLWERSGEQWWPWALGPNGSWDRNGDPLARTNQYQPLATQAISDLGIGDTDYGGGGGGGNGYNRTTVHHWAPNINVTVNGGAQGIDLRRTASLLADHLQGEMDKRLVRSS